MPSMNLIGAIEIKDLILRLTIATLVGGTLGANRDLHGKPAGIRTHALVALGAAIATVITLRSQMGTVGADPNAISRIIQGILTGVGFLGAGVILRDAAGHVTGLTTAATIWVCAAIGIVCGLGYWSVASVSAVLVFAVLVFGQAVERITERIFKRHQDGPPDHEV